MSNKPPAPVRKRVAAGDAEPDPRVARTTAALGQALIELAQEQDYRTITVQRILDRAGVSRATFYAHYRNKHDVLESSYERLFAHFARLLDGDPPTRVRLFPVAEFLSHVAEARTAVQALRNAGEAGDMWALSAAYAARIIEARLTRLSSAAATRVPGPLAARMLAGALIEMIAWWEVHPEASTPAEMDRAFHACAAGILAAPPGRLAAR